jgi:hypothetical protein
MPNLCPPGTWERKEARILPPERSRSSVAWRFIPERKYQTRFSFQLANRTLRNSKNEKWQNKKEENEKTDGLFASE